MNIVPRWMKRFACHLFGCVPGEFPCCDRCYADLYDDDWIPNETRLYWKLHWRIVDAWRLFVAIFLGHKCDVCGRRFRRGFNEYACSKWCFDNWMPF